MHNKFQSSQIVSTYPICCSNSSSIRGDLLHAPHTLNTPHTPTPFIYVTHTSTVVNFEMVHLFSYRHILLDNICIRTHHTTIEFDRINYCSSSSDLRPTYLSKLKFNLYMLLDHADDAEKLYMPLG